MSNFGDAKMPTLREKINGNGPVAPVEAKPARKTNKVGGKKLGAVNRKKKAKVVGKKKK